MGQDVLTLQEVADLLGKSTQTIRRMIKKGDLKAQRIRTAQGFQYGIYREQIPTAPVHEYTNHSPLPSPIQTPVASLQKPLDDEVESVLTSQLDKASLPVITPAEVDAFLDNDYYELESPSTTEQVDKLVTLLEAQHREKMMLIHILETLQAQLQREREKPRGIWAWILAKMGLQSD